jgi:tRNA dimethylallyltransferase
MVAVLGMRNRNHASGGEISLKSAGLVKGHDFSRADALPKTIGALAPEGSPSTSAAQDHAAAHSALSKTPSPVQVHPAPLVVILLGPTGSGKTALSLDLAERFNGEIISCDSVAVYRGMDLGSAKPSREELSRAPHHLIDVADPDEPMTAGEYSRRARQSLKEITTRGRLPIVTGGTGLYLRALTEGLFAGPQRDELLRDRLRASAAKRGSAWLYRLLTRLDSSTAQRIHANDTPKLIRAIEVCLAGRRPMSQVLDSEAARDPLTGYRLLRIGLNPPRAALYDRLNRRCADMFAAGLVDETSAFLARYGRVKALDSLGYRQALSVIDGEADLPAAVAAAQQGHRNYAKRQLTWFRREPDVHWIEAFGDDAATINTAHGMVEATLNARQCEPGE